MDNNEYTDSDVESYLSGGTGINYSSGSISIDSTIATQTWANSNFNDYTFSESYTDLTNKPAADAFTSTEVSNLRAGQLDDGTTPWSAHNYYDDADAQSAINNDADHGSTASHNYFSGSHSDLLDIGSSDHHSRYTDSEASAAAPVQSVASKTGSVSLIKSDVGLGNVPNTNIAYDSTIAADAFTSTEVSNLRAGQLDDGTTPWSAHNYYDDSDVDSHLSGSTGINYSSGTISIDSTVATQSWANSNFNNYSHPSDGDDPGTALSGATVFSDITVNTAGHVTGSATRDLTLSNLGFTGDSNANNYSLENHTISKHTDMDQTVQTTDDVTFNSTTYGDFKVEYNSTSNSLNFNYIG